MTVPPKPDPVKASDDPHPSLRETLPLLILTGAFFAGSYALYLTHPRLGPGNFPIWGLLLTLGCVAGIGSTVSWFFATDDVTTPAGIERPGSTVALAPVRGVHNDFGRPVPETAPRDHSAGPPDSAAKAVVRTRTPSAPWDEDVLPPVTAKGPRPVLTTPEDPGEIGRALEEIADIQRQLAARPPVPAAAEETSARA